jgi:myxalamid-type polyketide synthase MxaB
MGIRRFLEVGPGSALLAAGRSTLPDPDSTWLGSLSRQRPEWRSMLEAIQHLYMSGAEIDWSQVHRGATHQRLALPTYPFQRQMFWIDSPDSPQQRPTRHSTASSTNQDLHPLLGRRLHLARPNGAVLFESSLSPDSPAFLGDHRIHDAVIAPAAGFVEMAVAAATNAARCDEWEITNLSFEKALVLTGDATTVQLALSAGTERRFSFEIMSARTDAVHSEPTWVPHAAGFLVVYCSGRSDDARADTEACLESLRAVRVQGRLFGRRIPLRTFLPQITSQLERRDKAPRTIHIQPK